MRGERRWTAARSVTEFPVGREREAQEAGVDNRDKVEVKVLDEGE